MDEEGVKKIQNRIEQLKKERDAFLQNANQQLTAFGAVIEELERLIKPEPEPEPEPEK